MREQAKGAERLGPKGDGARKGPRTATPRGRKRHPVDSRHLPPRGLLERNVETSYLRLTERRARSFLPGTEPFSSCRPGSFRPAPCPIFSPLFGGQSRSGTVAIASRQAYRKGRRRRCGTGCWKKPRPVCNEPDTGQACPARKGAHVQQVLRCEKAGRTTLKREGDRRQEPMRRLLAHPLLRPVSAGQVASCKHRRGRSTYGRVAGSENRPLKCLSPVRGNSHAGFLEGCGGREAPVPTRHPPREHLHGP